jgi:peptidylprolyl isomerase
MSTTINNIVSNTITINNTTITEYQLQQLLNPFVPVIPTCSTDLTTEPLISDTSGLAPLLLISNDIVLGTGTVLSNVSEYITIQLSLWIWENTTFFGTSWPGPPFTFQLKNLIPGFKALIGMNVGGRRLLVIPPSLGYGSAGYLGIPPNSYLIFVVDLLGVSSDAPPSGLKSNKLSNYVIKRT